MLVDLLLEQESHLVPRGPSAESDLKASFMRSVLHEDKLPKEGSNQQSYPGMMPVNHDDQNAKITLSVW